MHGNVEKEIFSITSSLNFDIMTIILGEISQKCWMIAKRASKEIENHGNTIYSSNICKNSIHNKLL